jgi:predicted DNA-binding mobile mystery protein A
MHHAGVPDLARPPHDGWVRAVREALGMSLADLASRMHVAESTVLRLERGEKAGTTQLDTLRRAAEALDCELVYALVPRTPLTEQVDAQAHRVASRSLAPVVHTMALEGQTAPERATAALIEQHAEAWRDRPGLWHAD